ncbi:Asp-tRNA(Asn)/Glu-tRNA(Gln) amidotransferase subunit GatB [Elusimicrobiota bacterium]
MNSNKYQTVIGLEVHVHLKTVTKLFCRCRNEFGGVPNTHICPVCTGQPGSLPVINKQAVKQATKAALVLGCEIQRTSGTVKRRIDEKGKYVFESGTTGTFDSVFSRKQYFYPDLPKNYQISQYEKPLAVDGKVFLEEASILLTRVHMEEDAGKLIHTEGDISLVDYNRTGAPLIEVVTEPRIDSPRKASEYLKRLRQILRYCDISDCDMEKGSMRCDANISLKKSDDTQLGTKVEIKNMNSFKAVEKALEYEVLRIAKLLDEGEKIIQETRLWDESRSMTFSMRSKEEAHDYRYFPDPDLPSLIIEDALIDEIGTELPKELPLDRKHRYMEAPLCLSDYDAEVLTQDKVVADYFEEALKGLKVHSPGCAGKLSNWITVELFGMINSQGIEFSDQPVKPEYMAELIEFIEDGKISGKMAKDIIREIWDTGKSPFCIIEEKGLKQITSYDEIEKICQGVIDDNPGIVKKYLDGKEGVIGALVGGVMKKTQGQANPNRVNEKLKEILKGK